jgi:Spy/CpxP family protein refolding chaperone
MKTWIKRTLIGVVGATVLLGGFAAFAHRNEGHFGRSMSTAEMAQAKTRMVDRVADRMDLDTTQKAKLNTLADQLLAQRTALMAGTDPRQVMQGLVAGPAFDRAGAQALLDGKSDALRNGAPAVIAAFGDFYDSLQPAQQEKLREFMARGRHGHGHGHGDE